MRILKNKVQLRQQQKLLDGEKVIAKPEFETKTEETVAETADIELENSPTAQEYLLPMRRPRQKPTSPEGNSKNIVKNYGKALCSFASSNVATPYLENIVEKNNYSRVKVVDFMASIKLKKEKVNSIESLRKLLVPEAGDKEEELTYKRIFQQISIIFLKYFAANWIYSGKLMHKNAHLKFRFKMLRRIQNPEFFTYLKTSAK